MKHPGISLALNTAARDEAIRSGRNESTALIPGNKLLISGPAEPQPRCDGDGQSRAPLGGSHAGTAAGARGAAQGRILHPCSPMHWGQAPTGDSGCMHCKWQHDPWPAVGAGSWLGQILPSWLKDGGSRCQWDPGGGLGGLGILSWRGPLAPSHPGTAQDWAGYRGVPTGAGS